MVFDTMLDYSNRTQHDVKLPRGQPSKFDIEASNDNMLSTLFACHVIPEIARLHISHTIRPPDY